MSDYDDYEDDDWKPPSEAELKVIAAKRERSDKISKRMGDYLLKGYKMLATSCRVCSTIELQDKQGQKYCVACQEIDCHETSKDDPVLSVEAAGRVIAESAFASNAPKPESRNPDLIPGNAPSANQISSPSQNSPPISSTLSQPVPGPSSLPASISQSGQLSSPAPSTHSYPPSAPVPSAQPVFLSAQPQTTEQNASLTQPSQPASVNPPVAASSSEPGFVQSTRTVIISKLEWANSRLAQEQSIESTTALVVLIREIFSTLSTMNSYTQ